MSNFPLPDGAVVKYAPAVKFHADERVFPCSIEYLLKGATLNYRLWRQPEPIPNQQTGTPAIVAFQGYLYMLYTGAHDSQIWVTRSLDGTNWTDLQQIGQQTSVPAVAVFQGQLWMVYSGATNSQLWVTTSLDGLTWQQPQQIANQMTTVPALAAYGGQLHMCYRASTDSQLYWSYSSDGWNWQFQQIPNQATRGTPALTVIPGVGGVSTEQLLMVYPSSSSDLQLYQSRLTSSGSWTTAAEIAFQASPQVALTTYGDTAIMTYQGVGNFPQYYASTSTDGINWKFFQIAGQSGNVPALCTFQDRTYMIYTAPAMVGQQLYVTSTHGANITPYAPIQNPTQRDLANCGSDPDFWININDSQWRADNQPGPTTLYYAVQQDAAHWYVHYIFLYAGQHGQTVRSEFPLSQFNTQLWSVGEHPGDLERFMIKLQKGPGGTSVAGIEGVEYEAHGNVKAYNPNQVEWIDTTHAMVSIGLNNHSTWNEKIEGSPVADEGGNIPSVALIGNFFGNSFGDGSIMWYPYSQKGTAFIQLGLDAAGKPINDQIWATFKGRMGDSYATGLNGASYFSGGGLSTFNWGYVSAIWEIATSKGLIGDGLLFADGPRGPGDRAWVTPLPSPQPLVLKAAPAAKSERDTEYKGPSLTAMRRDFVLGKL